MEKKKIININQIANTPSLKLFSFEKFSSSGILTY